MNQNSLNRFPAIITEIGRDGDKVWLKLDNESVDGQHAATIAGIPVAEIRTEANGVKKYLLNALQPVDLQLNELVGVMVESSIRSLKTPRSNLGLL